METVQFVSMMPYLELPDEELFKVFHCKKGRQEIVILYSDELRKTLSSLSPDYFDPRFSDIVKYLKANNIPYTENYRGTSTI